jgi:hypothetical protein
VIEKEGKVNDPNVLVLDGQMLDLLSRLKTQLREKTNDGVIRKALALMAQVVELSGPERYFTLTPPDKKRTIKIRLD